MAGVFRVRKGDTNEVVEICVSGRPAAPGEFSLNGLAVDIPVGYELYYDILTNGYILSPKLPTPRTLLVTLRFTNEQQQRAVEGLMNCPGFVSALDVPPTAPAPFAVRPEAISEQHG